MTIGLKDLYAATVTHGTGGAITYGTPARLAKAITADLSVETAAATLYADDALDQEVKEFVKGELKLNMNDLDADGQCTVLGCSKDSNGVVVHNKDDVAPELAIGFRARKPGGNYKFVWLYSVTFGTPSESYQTKGESIEFKTPEITGTFKARGDGNWKADYVGSDSTAPGSSWFSAVYESPSSSSSSQTT